MRLETRLRTIEKRVRARRESRKHQWVYVDPLYFAREKLGFIADPWQTELLCWEEKRLILNCARQSGKSTTTAIRALHQALFFARSLILLISPSLRQSSELFRKVTDFLSILPVRPILDEDNKLSLRLRNGSRIVSLPSSESTIRGFSAPSLIIVDEASRVSDDLYRSLRPMLATSNGQLILMSTPFGRRGFFFEEWERKDRWKQIEVTADMCPRIPAEFLKEELETLGEWWFKQEYGCQFVETLEQLFSYESIQNSRSDIPALFEDDPLAEQTENEEIIDFGFEEQAA